MIPSMNRASHARAVRGRTPRTARARAAAALAAVALAMSFAANASARIPQGVPIARVKTSERVVALSFDDGPQPGPVLDSLLAIMARHDARATFFVIGHELAAHPELGRAMLVAGHELGNHTWTHAHLDSIPADSIRIELARTDSLLRALGQRGRAPVRPPYGALDDRAERELGRGHRTVALFDVDPSYDFPGMAAADSIADKTVLWLGPGSILVMHPWYGNDGPALAVLERVLARLRGLGYRIVTVSELLKTKRAVAEPSLYHRIE